MAKKQNRKIVKYRKPFHINIGIVVFVIIFLYLLYYIFSFFTTEHIAFYEVNQGTIAQNTLFEGLILRKETVYYAQDSGYINYYYKDGSKASVGNYVYSVDETGDFYNQMTASAEGTAISPESYQQLTQVAEQYMDSYSDYNFHQVYQFKYDMEAALVEALNFNAKNEISEAAQEGAAAGLHAYTADEAGIVVYNTDGLEDVTTDTFTAAMFDQQSYGKDNFLKRQKVSAGDAVYKLITSELWNIVIPISESLASDLKDTETIQVEFKKDQSKAWASSKIMTKDGACYLVLELKNSMVRFASDRYVELELLLTDTTGLKIPNTAITTKDFITVPKDYLTKGGDSDSDGLIIERTDKNGKKTAEFTKVTVFYETEDQYCIDSSQISLGDVALKPDSTESCMLKNTKTLEGVYNINKGYAVFKRIQKLFENEEYTIVESGTPYGLSIYDHIALESSAVTENDIVH